MSLLPGAFWPGSLFSATSFLSPGFLFAPRSTVASIERALRYRGRGSSSALTGSVFAGSGGRGWAGGWDFGGAEPSGWRGTTHSLSVSPCSELPCSSFQNRADPVSTSRSSGPSRHHAFVSASRVDVNVSVHDAWSSAFFFLSSYMWTTPGPFAVIC